MKQSRRFLEIALMSFFGLFLASCQKENPLSENQMIFDTEAETEISTLQLDLNSVLDYLWKGEAIIGDMLNEGLLNQGNANSLIAKIENAIKSIDNNNANALKGQLNALINEIKDFINNGLLTMEQAQPVMHEIENATMMLNGSFIDSRDGYEYPVVLIENQIWMAENLRATKYTDGTEIPNVINPNEWWNLTTGAYCWFGNNYDMFGSIYGALYNWYAVGTENLCPTGWHVPSFNEWWTLVMNLGGWDIAGGKLKEAGTTHWLSPNEGATNETGFTALPGGYRIHDGRFFGIRRQGYWWTSTEIYQGVDWAWYYFVSNYTSYISLNNQFTKYGFSVRCVRY